ncbi:hypothetical protein D3C78_1702860 [compost metagenome]
MLGQALNELLALQQLLQARDQFVRELPLTAQLGTRAALRLQLIGRGALLLLQRAQLLLQPLALLRTFLQALPAMGLRL